MCASVHTGNARLQTRPLVRIKFQSSPLDFALVKHTLSNSTADGRQSHILTFILSVQRDASKH
jgi:hypothetical protein